MKKSWMCFALAMLGAAGAAQAVSYQTKGQIYAISSNVAGLPEGLSSGSPATNTAPLGALLAGYDLVNVQEDFNYDTQLSSTLTLPYRTAFSGVAGIGDGMNTFSRVPLADTQRVKWNKSAGLLSNGSDQLTPKGLSYTRVSLQTGIYLDVYNLHADADTDADSMAARADNLTQLASYIAANSAGNAVLVMGDTNSRYTREGDVLRQQLIGVAGLSDAWIQLVRGGSYPAQGDAALMDDSNRSGAGNEVVDKLFYRSSRALLLTPSAYKVEDSKFVDSAGNQLSDHYPVSLRLSYALADDVQFSSTVGGSGGSGFNSLAKVAENVRLSTVTLLGASRMDGLVLSYANGVGASFGGSGGNALSLALGSGEYLSSAKLCANTKSTLRLFYLQLTTNLGHSVANGVASGSCQTITAPSGWQIGGFFGRAGTELDQLGLIFRPVAN